MKKALSIAVFAAAPLLALRWPLPIAIATLRGEGAFDRTILAFIIPVLLMLLGYPGYVAAAFGLEGRSRGARLWLRASILLILTASLLVLVWMVFTVLPMRTTLRNPIRNVAWLGPPIFTAVLAFVLRQQLRGLR